MRALRYYEFGSPNVLHVEDVPEPVPVAGEVLVRVLAAALNPSDVAMVGGRLGHPPLPSTPGRDLAGTIVAPAARRGEEVWAASGPLARERDGSHAELVAVPAALVRPKPSRLAMAEAAAAGLPYLTAAAALFGAGRLQRGEALLVTGAAGAVGGAAIALARWRGARTIALDRRPPEGADLSLTTATDDWPRRARDFTGGRGADLALDCVGGPLFEATLAQLAPGGRQIAIASPSQLRVAFDLVDFYHRRLTLIGLDTLALEADVCGDLLDEVRPGFESGALPVPLVERTISLAEAPAAFAALASGQAEGKIVIVP